MGTTECQTGVGVSREVIAETARTIDEFGLIGGEESVLVALSGGKDSLLLALTLSELGMESQSVVIDMGYEEGWAARVAASAASAGIAAEVIEVHALGRPVPAGDGALERNLRALSVESSPVEFTPCTYCYNAKVLAVESVAAQAEATKVAFGHHRTDAYASLLKEGLMYIDRWDRGNQRYARERFAALVGELADECRAPAGGTLLERIAELVEEGLIDTDEPPRQPLREGSAVEIVRPFFAVDETSILAEKVRLELPTEPSGCGHGATVDTETSREMVHRAVLQEACGEESEGRLSRTLDSAIAADGTGRAQARRRRSQQLGEDYKPVLDGLQKL